MSHQPNQYNKYGFVSGGALFDMLDRFALRKINFDYPETDSENWFATSAEITFLKYANPNDSFYLHTNYIERKNNLIYIDVEARNEAQVIICSGAFTFKLIPKGGNDGAKRPI